MSANRRLWIDDDVLKGSKAIKKEAITYDEIFHKFSSRKPCTPFVVLLGRGLVVAQEFILSCLLLATHRVALAEERLDQESMLGDEFSTSLLLAIWTLFICLVAWYGKVPAHSKTMSRNKKLRTRVSDALFMAVLLRFLASVLRTLTASYSSDTVHTLAVASLLLHLLACDYNYANGIPSKESYLVSKKRPAFMGGILSLTSAFFATTLLASRLQDNMSVYVFVSFSVILFALYPAARHQVAINTHTSNRWGKSIEFESTMEKIVFLILLQHSLSSSRFDSNVGLGYVHTASTT